MSGVSSPPIITMGVYALGDRAPKLAADAWVAPTAAVVGDVEMGAGASVWFGAVVRGDINFIRIGARSNVQDNAVLHVSRQDPCILEENVLVGHTAILHGCLLRAWAFIGMGATVLNGAVVEEGGMLAAHSMLSGGKRIGPGELWAGSPARMIRLLSPEERAEYAFQCEAYVDNAALFRASLRPVGGSGDAAA